MVLLSRCTVNLWQDEMGVMVCRMYKTMYSFSVVSLVVSMGIAVLDYRVLKQDKTAGVYHSLIGADKLATEGMARGPMIKA